MEKLDIAIYWDAEEECVCAPDPTNIQPWTIWEVGDIFVQAIGAPCEYETRLDDTNTIVLEGVAIEDEVIKSIDTYKHMGMSSLSEYPSEFIGLLNSLLVSGADEFNPVTKPAGYQLTSGKELKDVLPELMGKDETIAFYKGSAIKYLMRYREKNGAEDLEKAVQYIEMIKQLEYSA